VVLQHLWWLLLKHMLVLHVLFLYGLLDLIFLWQRR
jgi:hypothetical protein